VQDRTGVTRIVRELNRQPRPAHLTTIFAPAAALPELSDASTVCSGRTVIIPVIVGSGLKCRGSGAVRSDASAPAIVPAAVVASSR
jgi:hypothetical protein